MDPDVISYNQLFKYSWSHTLNINVKLHILPKTVEFFLSSFECSIQDLGPVHMIPGQLMAPGQLTDPGVNFASVHGLKPVTVHMSFSLPRDNFERRVTRCTTPGNPPCRGKFSPCEQNSKVAPGQE